MNTQVSFKNWKIKVTLFMAIIVVLIAFVSSCEKEKDYRDKWVGTYDFKIRYQSAIPLIHYSLDTTYFYLGSVIRSANDTKVIVDWGNDTIRRLYNGEIFTQKSELTVDLIGQLTCPEYNEYGGGNTYFGSSTSCISGDTISFYIKNGSLGARIEWNVIGIKQHKIE